MKKQSVVLNALLIGQAVFAYQVQAATIPSKVICGGQAKIGSSVVYATVLATTSSIEVKAVSQSMKSPNKTDISLPARSASASLLSEGSWSTNYAYDSHDGLARLTVSHLTQQPAALSGDLSWKVGSRYVYIRDMKCSR